MSQSKKRGLEVERDVKAALTGAMTVSAFLVVTLDKVGPRPCAAARVNNVERVGVVVAVETTVKRDTNFASITVSTTWTMPFVQITFAVMTFEYELT